MARLTVKERLLLHLYEFAKFYDSWDVPEGITQNGIAKAMEIRLAHVSQYVRPLIREGLARERMAHVPGVRRKLKAYDLTELGKREAARLRESVRSEIVRVRGPAGTRSASVAEVMREAGPGASLFEVIRQAAQGVVDPALLVPPPPESGAVAPVERLADAPQPGGFVGRAEELARLTAPQDSTRVFVVRGVAGIGKSFLAAKACAHFRGKRPLLWHRVRPWDTRGSIVASLAEFLAALGRPALQSVLSSRDTAHADPILRQDLPGTGAFLVFDDVHDATAELIAFFAFLKDIIAEAPDVRILVLTRRKLPFYDRRHVVLGGLVAELDLEGFRGEDIEAFMATSGGGAALVDLGRRLGGHPLSLELLRSASPASPDVALRDVRHFIEEEIYRELSDRERTVMKTASPYRIAVPREVLMSMPSSSHDIVLSLQNRALLRPVGDDAYEVHDTIRDFFHGLLTPSERQALGAMASNQLRSLAQRAFELGDYAGCIDCASNALELLSEREDPELDEFLGDAHARIGDLPSALEAYRQALTRATGGEARARAHRKRASAFEDRGDVTSASEDVEAGLAALGDAASVERGWLDLIACRVAYRLADWERARDAGESALRGFESFRVQDGQARGHLILGHIAMHSPQNDPSLAARHLTGALELSETAGDPEFAADTRIALAHLLAWHLGDIEGAIRHADTVEGLLATMDLPRIRRKFRLFRGMFRLVFFADYRSAEDYFRAALADAEQIRDTATIANAKVGLGYASYFQGRFTEARGFYEQAVEGLRTQGLLVDAVNILLGLSEAFFLEGDQPNGFRILGLLLSDPSLKKAVDARSFYVRLTEGYTYLIGGQSEDAYEALTDAVHRAEAKAGIGEGTMTYDFVGCISWPAVYALLYSGVALRFLGRKEEGDAQIARAREVARRAGARAWEDGIQHVGQRLSEVLEELLKSQGGPSDDN